MIVNAQKELYRAWSSQTNFLAKTGQKKKSGATRVTDLIFEFGEYPAQVRIGARCVKLRDGWIRRMLAAYKKAINDGSDSQGAYGENRIIAMHSWFKACKKRGVPATFSMESYQFHARRMKKYENELPPEAKAA